MRVLSISVLKLEPFAPIIRPLSPSNCRYCSTLVSYALSCPSIYFFTASHSSWIFPEISSDLLLKSLSSLSSNLLMSHNSFNVSAALSTPELILSEPVNTSCPLLSRYIMGSTISFPSSFNTLRWTVIAMLFTPFSVASVVIVKPFSSILMEFFVLYTPTFSDKIRFPTNVSAMTP